MPEALVITQVEVEKAPGFGPGRLPVLTGLRSGLNVVWGPNGIGKSTLARALKGLLWRSPEDRLEAVAQARAAGRDWQLERRGLTLRQVARDSSHAPGQWGGQADADRYWFALHDLLDQNNRGQAFQAEILSEMQGGVDLERACAEAGGDPRPLAPQSSVFGALARAVRTHHELSTEHARQRHIRDEITRAEANLARALEASRELEAHRKVKALLKARARLANANAAFNAFPPGLQRISSEDPAQLAALEGRWATLKDECGTLEAALQDRQASQDALRISPALLSDSVQKQRLQEGRERLQQLEPAVAQAEAALLAAQASEQAWREACQWLLPEPPARPMLQDLLDPLRQLALRSEPLRCGLAAAQRRVEALGMRETGGSRDTVQAWVELQACLKAWQRETLQASGVPAIPRKRATLVMGVTAILALAVAALALTLWPPLVLAGLLAPVLVWILLRPGAAGEAAQVAGARASAAQTRQQAEDLLAPFPELQPADWTASGVLELQAQVAARLGQTETRALRNGERDRAATELNQAKADYDAWFQAWHTAATRLGLRPGEPALQEAPFFHFAQGLFEWVQRLETLAQAQAEVKARRARLLEAQALLGDLLTALGAMAPAETLDHLVDQAQVLLERRETAVLLADQARALREQLRRKQAERQNLEVELRGFWTARGLAEPDRPGLAALAAQVEPRKDAARELRVAGEELQAHRDPDLEAAAGATTLEALEAEDLLLREEAATAAERAETCLNLKVNYEGLVKGEALAQAMEAEVRARAAFQEAQRRTALNQVVHLLATDLKANTLLEEQPIVLQGASARLQQFTAHRYELGIQTGKGFYARDTVLNRTLELDELSSGTRVQLLFAVRLAFIEAKEGTGLKMPLFLDEVLANSDDDRAGAMISALLEIAKERQVFYFTAQTDEVAKLRGAAGAGAIALFPMHQLAQDREQALAPLNPIPLSPYAAPEPLADYAAYGLVCQVPGAQLFGAVEALHAWHLFTRSEDLHFFLQRGAQRAGQLLASTLPEAEGPRRRVALLCRAQALAQLGRGRPFRLRDLLEARLTGVNVTADYWTGITEAAEAAGGDAARFRLALAKVTRAGKAKAIIEAWLVDSGYLSDQVPLSADAVLLAVFESFDGLKPGTDDHRVLERYLRAILPERAHV